MMSHERAFPCASVRPLRVSPGGREGGALMTGATVRESVKVAGLVERVRVVRSFVGAVLGPGILAGMMLCCS